MELINELKEHLCGEFAVSIDQMPASPELAVALYPLDIRPPGDAHGSDLLIHVRGPASGPDGLTAAVKIANALDGFAGRLTPGGADILNAQLLSGPAAAGLDAAHRPFYTVTLRMHHM